MWMLSFTDMGGDKTYTLLILHLRLRCETGVKDIQICIHAIAGPEIAKQSFKLHIIISVLQTFK